MKTKLANKPNQSQDTRRGRIPLDLQFPKRKTGFTVQEAVDLNKKKRIDVSPLTVRQRLNKMTQEGEARAVSVPRGRGHPIYVYTLVA